MGSVQEARKLALRPALHLARLVAFAVSKFALSLAVLKVLEFDALTENHILLLRLLLVTLLTHYPEEAVAGAFERIAGNEQLFALRTGLAMFFKHYLADFTVGVGDGGAKAGSLDAEAKAALLHRRIKVAKLALARGPAVPFAVS